MEATQKDPSAWQLVPRFLLRRAGFGFELLCAVGEPAVEHAVRRYRGAVLQTDRIRANLLRKFLPAAVSDAGALNDREQLKVLSAVRSRVGRHRAASAPHGCVPPGSPLAMALDRYERAHADQATAAEMVAAELRTEQTHRADRLRAELTPHVLDAVLQVAPSFYDALQRWSQSPGRTAGTASRDRALVRRLYLYLQRLASKNETTSFFGPLVHGVISTGSTGVRFGPDTPQGVVETRGFLAFWAANTLARTLVADPRIRPHAPVTVVPAARLDADALTLPTGRRLRMTADLKRLAPLIDGERSSVDLAAATGLPSERVDDILDRLERLGAVRRHPEPPSTVFQPLDHVEAFARRHAAGTEWPRRLRELRVLVDRYAEAPGPERRRTALTALEASFTSLTGTEPRRAGGQMYADRMIAYADCHGDLGPVLLGRDLADRTVTSLAPVLDFGACYGEHIHRANRELAASVLREAEADRLPYDEFVRRMSAAVGAGGLDPLLVGAERFSEQLTTLVRKGLEGDVAVLDPADLRELGSPGAGARFASPDVLLRQTDDGPGLVLGEVHPYVFAWGSQSLFCEDPDGLQADFAADLSPWGGTAKAATVLRRRVHKGLVADTFPGRFVEITAYAGADRRRLPVTELCVAQGRDGPVLLDGNGGPLVLYAGENDHPHLTAFAPAPVLRLPLVRFGDVAPRIVVGDLIVQRACWWFPAEQLAGPAGGDRAGPEAFLRIQRLRARTSLPRWVYAHLPAEPKPICLDLDAPLAVEVLMSLAAAAGGTSVALSEMLPEPDALWLHKQGRATTSELRLALVRAGDR